MVQKTWTFQLDSLDYRVVVEWNRLTEAGRIVVNHREVDSWTMPFWGLKRRRFALAGHQAKIVPEKRSAMGALNDIDLVVDGRYADQLPSPKSLVPAQVISSNPYTCPKCSEHSVMMIYSTGICEIVCPNCGRSRIG